MKDVREDFARRLHALNNDLSIVVSIHLFAEYLLDLMIQAKSPIAKEILRDHRTYTFSVKLALVHHMRLLTDDLFKNLRALNSLRNKYAHQIDVALAESIEKSFVDREARPLFSDSESLRRSVRDYPDEVTQALFQISQVTFGWLHDVMEERGILN